MLIWLSLFSGIHAEGEAWKEFGWGCRAFAETDKACCAFLAEKHPEIPNLGDVAIITETQIQALGHIDLVVFGSPCQDLSVAGKRAGIAGERSSLFFDAVRIVRWSRARLALWENVPGAFSSNEGRDFTAVVGALTGVECGVPEGGWENTGVALGPGGFIEWSVLDAQWFGVAQRRERVFVVADFGDWAGRPPILLERESLQGNPSPRRAQRKNVAPTLEGRAGRSGANNFATSGGLVAPPLTSNQYGDHESREGLLVAHALNAKGGAGRSDFESETFITHTLRADGFDASEDGTGRGIPLVAETLRSHPRPGSNSTGAVIAPPITSTDGGGAGVPTVAFPCKDHGADAGELAPTLRAMEFDESHANGGGQIAVAYGISNQPTPKFGSELMLTLNAHDLGGGAQGAVVRGSPVRRLTPIECERLQGLPDNYTHFTYRGKPVCDGPRYRMLGNSWAVPVLRWIGLRIKTALEVPT